MRVWCPRPWFVWSFKHMTLWAQSAEAVLGPACNASLNLSINLSTATTLPSAATPLLAVRYEDMVGDQGAALEHILTFLGTCERSVCGVFAV